MDKDKTGMIIGVLTFLAGVILLVITFTLAYHLYQTPIGRLLGIQSGVTIDVNKLGEVALRVLTELILRSLMLLVMSLVGGFIAHRGIKLYLAARRS